MTQIRPLRPPVAVYVLFHPESEQCSHLATRVLQWLRLQEDDGDGSAVGLPVYLRTEPRPLDGAPVVSEHTTGALRERMLGAVSPPISDDAQHIFLVPLVDDLAVGDDAWRQVLLDLGVTHDLLRDEQPDCRIWLLPVMVDRSFDDLRALALNHNPLRIWNPDDIEPGVPPRRPQSSAMASTQGRRAVHPGSGSYASELEAYERRKDTWRDARARRLRRALTEEMIRSLDTAADRDVPDVEADPAALAAAIERFESDPRRLKVFISHAKADGVQIAQRIRDRLATVSRLEAWFDKNDLFSGRNAADPMHAAARDSTGGLIAVVTDVYPTRPWCWREAAAARTPRKLPGFRFITSLPSVAVHVAERRWSRLPSPLMAVPHIGWPARPGRIAVTSATTPPGVEIAAYRERDRLRREMDDRVSDVVDRLLLELLLHRFNRRRGKQLVMQNPGMWFLDFVPDARSLQLVLQIIASEEASGHVERPQCLIPGTGPDCGRPHPGFRDQHPSVVTGGQSGTITASWRSSSITKVNAPVPSWTGTSTAGPRRRCSSSMATQSRC